MSLDVCLLKELRPHDFDDMNYDEQSQFYCDSEIYSGNVTHNLNKMADAAGIYEYLWRPDEINVTQAHELIEPLSRALGDLYARREHYEQFSPANGWGTWSGFVEFVRLYLEACIDSPDAYIEVSR